MTARHPSLLLIVALAAPACVSTSGRAWLEAPVDSASVASTEVYVAAEPVPAARPRLRHTITLGESYGSAAEHVATAPSSGSSSVNVTVATYVPVTVNTYVSAGGVDAPPAAPVAPVVRSSTPGPGQDFPAPPSYGPAFPYHSGPASPWAR